MSVTISPLISSVTVANTTVNDILMNCTVTLAGDGRASTFDLSLFDTHNSYTNTFKAGDEVAVSVAKSVGSLTNIFTGLVDRTKIDRPEKNVTIFSLGGADYSTKLMNTIVPGQQDTGSYHSDSIVRQSGWSISEILDDLMSKHVPDITTNNVTHVSNTILPDVVFNYQPLSDCIKELADYAPLYTFYVDGNKDLHFFFEEARDSGVILDNTLIRSLTVEVDTENTKNRAYILGGDELLIDINNTTASASVTTFDFWRASRKTLSQVDLRDLQLYISKTGNPPTDFEGEIRETNGNNPTGSVVKIFSIPKSKILNAGWYQANINYHPINTGKDHWIIAYKSGGDSSNTYNWFHNNSTDGSISTSTDGTSWSNTSSTYTFAAKTIYGKPLVLISEDDPSIKKYGAFETTISQPNITRRDQADIIGRQYMRQSARARKELRMSIFPPDQILLPGQTVYVSDTPTSTSGNFLITEITYSIKGYETYDVGLRCFGQA